MSYGIVERADATRAPGVKTARETLEEGRAWIREQRAKGQSTDERPTRNEGGAYGVVEHARKNRGPESRNVEELLEEGRAWIREHKGDVEYQRRKLEEEDRALEVTLARMTPDIARMRRELDEEDIYVAEIVDRTERMERMRTLPATEHEYRDAIAYHEAGHAVVGFIEGNGVASVSIEVEGNRAVSGLYRPKRGAPSVRCDVAGYQGTDLANLGHVLPKTRAVSDYRAAQKTGADIPTAERDARHMLRTHWGAVKALATELAWAGEIQGDEAEEIIRNALSSR